MDDSGNGSRKILDRDSSTRVIGVMSGKGGVGKSTVAVNLAAAMKDQAKEVAILDADIYGFSIPTLMGASREELKPGRTEGVVVPPAPFGISCVSLGMFVEEGTPVIWRGPMLDGVLQQFLGDIDWGEPEVLVIDLPPGTGDVLLSLAQRLPRMEVVLVTTPHPAAQAIAGLAGAAVKKLKLPLRGVVENMSRFTCDSGEQHFLFGRGGGASLAAQFGVPLLASIPFVPFDAVDGTCAPPLAFSDPGSEAAGTYRDLASKLLEVGRPRVYHPGLALK